jgi:hypothetical protein
MRVFRLKMGRGKALRVKSEVVLLGLPKVEFKPLSGTNLAAGGVGGAL